MMEAATAGGEGAWCADCHIAIAPMRAAWGEARCRGCEKRAEPREVAMPAVPLADIDDIVGYVIAVVKRRFAALPRQEQEEYIAEGIAIAYRLHRDSWDNGRTPSFRDYLSTYLPMRLRDYRRADLRQAGESRAAVDARFAYVGKDSLDALHEAGHELAAPDCGELA